MITREVLQLTPSDIEEWKLILTSQRIFPISYTAGRRVVNKVGKVVGIHLRPLKGSDILPRCFPSKGLRYVKQTKAQDSSH